MCPLPILIDDDKKLRMIALRLINTNSKNFNTNDAVKFLFVVLDYLHSITNNGVISDGEICIFDAKDFSIWHFFKLAGCISTVRLFMRFVQEAVPHRLVQNHFVNCSPILTKVIALIKPFMQKELSETLHFHTDGLESLHKMVPKIYLPSEYGGSLGSIDKIYEDFMRSLNDARDFVGNDENWGLKN